MAPTPCPSSMTNCHICNSGGTCDQCTRATLSLVPPAPVLPAPIPTLLICRAVASVPWEPTNLRAFVSPVLTLNAPIAPSAYVRIAREDTTLQDWSVKYAFPAARSATPTPPAIFATLTTPARQTPLNVCFMPQLLQSWLRTGRFCSVRAGVRSA